MKLIKKLTAVFAAAAMALTLAGCGKTEGGSGQDASGSGSFRTVDQIKESGELKIGVVSDNNPVGYVDNDGSYKGYD
ncbi:MAG: amino acid ABC transporter substrate-binding protein, partial [Oscillospiraceae bacterium]|nr:amino acid ABC transporter substrate-binding protein [Oscillospiraceae bacterium]